MQLFGECTTLPMEQIALSFTSLLDYLGTSIAQMIDLRRPSNNTRYTLEHLVVGAFIAFFMQSESFLEHQRQLNSRCGRDNAQTWFGLERIPTVCSAVENSRRSKSDIGQGRNLRLARSLSQSSSLTRGTTCP